MEVIISVEVTSPSGNREVSEVYRDVDTPISDDYLNDIAYDEALKLASGLFSIEMANNEEVDWDSFWDSCDVEWHYEKS